MEVHQCNYNWKTFIEVYLEDYHVGPFHPGLGRFVTCEDLSWEFAEQYSLQRVGVHDSLEKPGSDVYRDWHDTLMRYRGGSAPDYGAIWVTYFPTHMIELYPHAGAVHALSQEPAGNHQHRRVLLPRGNRAVRARVRRGPARAAYMETAVEDDEIGERMDAGRLALRAGACPRAARTSRRWRTACCISMSGTGASWASASAIARPDPPRDPGAPGRREAHAQRMTVTITK